MNRRLELHQILCDILGSRHVYFQPPESVKMEYPAIVYGLDNLDPEYADDGVYLLFTRYSVTVIDKNPDSEFPAKVARLPTCKFNRHYKRDNLNHYVFVLYY